MKQNRNSRNRSILIIYQLIFYKCPNEKQWGPKGIFSKTGDETIGYSWDGKKINFNPYLTPLTKITLRWTTDVKVNSKPIKLLEKNICIIPWFSGS